MALKSKRNFSGSVPANKHLRMGRWRIGWSAWQGSGTPPAPRNEPHPDAGCLLVGTDPSDGPQVTAFSTLPRNGYALAWRALPDEVFDVESSVDLSAWSPVTQIAPPGTHPVVHLAADGPTEFFRVRRLER